MAAGDAFAKLLDRWRTIAGAAQSALVRAPAAELGPRERAHVRAELAACIEGRSGEVASRARAAALGETYIRLNRAGRQQFLGVLAEFGPDRSDIARLAAALPDAGDDEAFARAANDVRRALEPPALAVFKQFNSLPAGIKFLVDLRADLLELRADNPPLARLERILRDLLASWFDIGFLSLQRITWDAPASLLERLAAYEAVHEVRNWRDLKNRLDTDRRCYAFFHPLMPDEPLIFIEVALATEIAGAVGPLLDTAAPLENPQRATTAIFYSISNCQQGLSGISFGNALIKRVVADLTREYPQLKTFATLSPVPGFTTWLRTHDAADAPLLAALEHKGWQRDPEVASAVRASLVRLCAHYLLEEKRRDGTARDPVAHFHLSNGARIERINWLADTSSKGLRESAGLMVNYLYQLDKIDENHESYANGTIAYSPAIKALLNGKT
jgi:malonyl-CoA decarboxylase